jgi:hypothetical protein
MKETGTFLDRRAVLASAVAIPLAAVATVVLRDDSGDRLPCDAAFDHAVVWDAGPAPFDCVEEDDGEP